MVERDVGLGERMDSRLRRSVLRTALRASVGAARLGVNLGPLPPAKVPQRLIGLDYHRYFRYEQMRIVVSAEVQRMRAMIARDIFPIRRRRNDFIRSYY